MNGARPQIHPNWAFDPKLTFLAGNPTTSLLPAKTPHLFFITLRKALASLLSSLPLYSSLQIGETLTAPVQKNGRFWWILRR